MPTQPETVRRLQIAIIGLIAVILVGSLARVIVEKADEQSAPDAVDVVTGEPLPEEEPTEPQVDNADEPLAELGVQPTTDKAARENSESPDVE